MSKYTMVVVVGALAACGGKKDEAPAEKASTGHEAPAPAKGSEGPDVSAWGDTTAVWQGSWVVWENGHHQAWTVAGTKVESWDGTKDETLKLVPMLPCRVGFEDEIHQVYPRNFTAVDGKLRYHSMGAGFRKDDKAIVCDMSGDLWTVDHGTCTRWKDHFGSFEKAEGECGFKKNDEGVEVFFHGEPYPAEFAVEGDAIMSKSRFQTEPASDQAAAKARRDELHAAK